MFAYVGGKLRLFLWCWLLALSASVSAEDDRTKLIKSIADQHAVLLRDSAVQLERRPDPVLVWSNPVRGDTTGGIFLWCKGQRPLAFGGVYIWVENRQTLYSRELHSLTQSPLLGTHNGQIVWAPLESKLEYRDLVDVPEPSQSALVRMRQIKRIALEFDVEISQANKNSDKLRVLPTPIYRYSDDDAGIVDGAIVAFCQGNDPELMMLIEAYQNKEKSLAWRYACARCTGWGIEAKRREATVFKASVYRFGGTPPTSPFLILTKRPL